MVRRRGNPTWGSGRPLKAPPDIPNEFEVMVRQLGLTRQTYAASDRLRAWCEVNRNRCYVPEWLLDLWEIPVDPNFT